MRNPLTTRSHNPFLTQDPWKRFDSLFEDFFTPAQGESWKPLQSFNPAVDIEENEKEYVLHGDLPGLKKEDIKLDVQEDSLTLSGERKSEREEKKDSWTYTERSYGSFRRSFQFKTPVDLERTEAKYENGVLTVKLPKKSDSLKARQIRIV